MDSAERTEGHDLRQQVGDSGRRRHSEATVRLLASIAQDVRNALASIVCSADFLDARGSVVSPDVVRATAHDIGEASRRLQLTVDSLLDYAQLGPSISVPVSLREVLSRAQRLLRSFERDGAHGFDLEIGHGAEWVRGNPVVVEQIFVSLLLSQAELAHTLSVVTFNPGATPGLALVRIVGEGAVDQALSASALADAKSAVLAQGGSFYFERNEHGGSLVVGLPRSEGPR